VESHDNLEDALDDKTLKTAPHESSGHINDDDEIESATVASEKEFSTTPQDDDKVQSVLNQIL